ncbi:uncharacterized protein [Ciconia boyciana]|uniref:uncharacterized protein n=1 Tax=Ciconia boyciana TaxID=52775 RepID=UPI003BA0C48D
MLFAAAEARTEGGSERARSPHGSPRRSERASAAPRLPLLARPPARTPRRRAHSLAHTHTRTHTHTHRRAPSHAPSLSVAVRSRSPPRRRLLLLLLLLRARARRRALGRGASRALEPGRSRAPHGQRGPVPPQHHGHLGGGSPAPGCSCCCHDDDVTDATIRGTGRWTGQRAGEVSLPSTHTRPPSVFRVLLLPHIRKTYQSSSVKLEDVSGGETLGSSDTQEGLDSSGSMWKKTKRQRSSNLHRPGTRQIKYTSHYLCLYLKICIFWGTKECVQSRRPREEMVIDNCSYLKI